MEMIKIKTKEYGNTQITNPFLSDDYFPDLEILPGLPLLFPLGGACIQHYLLKFSSTTTPFFCSTREQQLTKLTMPSVIIL